MSERVREEVGGVEEEERAGMKEEPESDEVIDDEKLKIAIGEVLVRLGRIAGEMRKEREGGKETEDGGC